MRFGKNKKSVPESDGKVQAEGKVSGKRVLIYTPTITGTMDVLFVEGYIRMLNDCWEWKKKGWEFFPLYGKRMFIQNARNLAVEHALRNNMDYLFFIDDDMVIKSNEKLFTKLVEHDKDIIAPLFIHRRQPLAPLIFKREMYGGGRYTTFDNILSYQKGLVQVDGVGFGCVLIKMEVFSKLKKPYFVYGDTYGEDLYFCNNAINKGVKIFCDTRITLGHIGDPVVMWEENHKENFQSTKIFMEQKKRNDARDSAKLLSEGKDVTKKVSIILESKDNPKYINNSIESILHQSYPNFELLIVDNSTNGKVKGLIESVTDDRIRRFYGEKDIKKEITGDYVTTLNDSGWFYPQRLEIMVNFLNNNSKKFKKCHTQRAVYKDNEAEKKLELLRKEQSTVFSMKVKGYRGSKSQFIKTTLDGFISCKEK